MFRGHSAKFLECQGAGFGEPKFGMPAIFLAALAFDQSFLHQFIDQHHHATGHHAEPFGQPLLVTGWRGGDQAQDSGVRGREAQRRDALAKTESRMSAELSEQKGHATAWTGFAGIHKKYSTNHSKKLVAKINSSYYESFMERNNTPPGDSSVPITGAETKDRVNLLPLRGRLRWWIPASILAIAAANVVRLRFTLELDTMSRNMQTFFTVVVSLLALLAWWLFLTRLRWRTRLAGAGLVLLCGFTLNQLVRIDGSADGRGSPKIVWKWAPRKSGDVGGLKSAGLVETPPKLEGVADYPGYLGSNRSGVVAGAQLESDWTAHPPEQLWRRPVGLGWSAFAVLGRNAVTQEQRGENELVVCYDLATGNPLWSHTNLVRFSEPMGGDGPRATPTIDHGRVYALGATGILDCLDAAAGKLIWTRDTLKEDALPNTYFGKCSSPLLVDDLVVVTGGMAKRSTLLAFRREDGSPVWRAGNDEASFSSPELVTLAGRRQILSVNASTVTGHEPKDGHVLWEYAWANNKWPKCVQPVVIDGDRVLLSASFNAGCVLLQIKAGAQGELSATEVWKNRNMKSEFSNLVVRDGFLYGLDDGILACVDLSTGERKWKDGRYGHGQVMLVNDWLLVQTEPGAVVVVEANPARYHEVTRLNALAAKTWNTPALAGEFLLVRNDQEAACYRLQKHFPKKDAL